LEYFCLNQLIEFLKFCEQGYYNETFSKIDLTAMINDKVELYIAKLTLDDD